MRRTYTMAVCSIFLLLIFGAWSSYRTGEKLPYIDFRRPSEVTDTMHNQSRQRPLLIALATVMSPHETIAYYCTIADYVSAQTGRPTVLVQRKTYAEVNMLLANGDVDLAFLSTGAYSSYRGMNEIELLVMAEYNGTTLYTADIIVPKDSNIYSFQDLQGKVFAFTDPLSHSGHMVVEDYLRKQHTVPERFFKRYFYTYSHDKSLWAVANKIADGASFDSQIYEYVKSRNPALTDKVRIISSIDPAPTGPVVISKKVKPEQKDQLRTIFLTMHDNPDTDEAMHKLMIDRFVPPIPTLYDPLKKLYDRTGGAL